MGDRAILTKRPTHMKENFWLIAISLGVAILVIDGLMDFGGEIGPSAEQVQRLATLNRQKQNRAIQAGMRENFEYFKKLTAHDEARLRETILNSDNPGERMLALEDLRKREQKEAEEERQIEAVGR